VIRQSKGIKKMMLLTNSLIKSFDIEKKGLNGKSESLENVSFWGWWGLCTYALGY